MILLNQYIMKTKNQRIKRPPKINTLFTHKLQLSSNLLLSPMPKNIVKCDEASISPSPRKTQIPTPSKSKFKKSPSKLFQAARATTESETFLLKGNSVAFERFASTEKAGKKIEKNMGKGLQRPLCISNEFSIAINALQSVADLSMIINQFQNGVFGVLQNITENSEQVLQLNSKPEQFDSKDSAISLT